MTEYILFIIYLLLFAYLIKKWHFLNSLFDYRLMTAIFLFKISCGISVAYIYSSFYSSGDTFGYMDGARKIYNLLPESTSIYLQFISGIELDKTTLHAYYVKFLLLNTSDFNKPFLNPLITLRINAFLCLFSFGYYYVQILFMCFLSLIGLAGIFKAATEASGYKKWQLFTACFCIPCVLFWGSAVLQEPLILFFLGMLIYNFNHWIRTKRWYHFLIAICFSLLLFGLKPYIIAALLPGLIAWYVYAHYKKSLLLLFSISYSTAFLLAAIIHKINFRFSIFRALNDQQIIFLKNAVFHPANSLIELIPFAPNPVSALKRSPEAIWVALLRPYLNECKNVLQYFAAIENLLVFLFIIMLIINIDLKKLNTQSLSILCMFAGLIILIITAFTTPVLGTLVRLKMPGILLLVIGLSSASRSKSIWNS